MAMVMQVFRWTPVLLAVALLTQAALAGLALSGVGAALDLHMALGAATLAIAAVQAAAAVLLWRSRKVSPWAALAAAGFLVVVGLEAAAGAARIYGLHLPLGLALFAVAARMAVRARRLPARSSAPRPSAAGGSRSEVAATGH